MTTCLSLWRVELEREKVTTMEWPWSPGTPLAAPASFSCKVINGVDVARRHMFVLARFGCIILRLEMVELVLVPANSENEM